MNQKTEIEKRNVIEKSIKDIMRELDIKENPNNIDTPCRIAKMLMNQLFVNRNEDNLAKLISQMTTFLTPVANSDNKEPIKIKGIKFYSTCEHHWLPFYGECDIEYIPSIRILGLSKFPRVVKHFSKKPQVQERLTNEIGDFLFTVLHPLYLKVTLRDVTHTCVSARGIETECQTTTNYVRRGLGYEG